MADLNLRELSAPIRYLRTEVKAAHKRLDAKWRDIHDTFNKLPIPGSVSYVYDSNPDCPGDQYTCIEWFKWKGKKRICKVRYEENGGERGPVAAEVTPVEEWSTDDRTQLLEHVPELFNAAEEVTQEFIKKTMFLPDEDVLQELLMERGFNVANGEEMSGFIAESNGCGWGPDVAEDIEIERDGDAVKFKAVVKYFPEGPYSDDVGLLYTKLDEIVVGTVEFLDGVWAIDDCESEFKSYGIMGDDQDE